MVRARVSALVARYSIMAIVTLLIVEFLLGMWVNVYAALPVGMKLTLSQQPNFSGKLEVDMHLVVGVLLGIAGIVALIFAALLKKAVLSVLALVGVILIAVAGFSGLALANGGYSNNAESYVMAIAFLAATLLYVNLGRLVSVPSNQFAKTAALNTNQP